MIQSHLREGEWSEEDWRSSWDGKHSIQNDLRQRKERTSSRRMRRIKNNHQLTADHRHLPPSCSSSWLTLLRVLLFPFYLNLTENHHRLVSLHDYGFFSSCLLPLQFVLQLQQFANAICPPAATICEWIRVVFDCYKALMPVRPQQERIQVRIFAAFLIFCVCCYSFLGLCARCVEGVTTSFSSFSSCFCRCC